MEFKKVLVISHDSFSRITNNGKTLASLFKDWPPDKIAQLFFQPEEPDFSICRNFYQLTDGDRVRKLLGGKGEGTEIRQVQNARRAKQTPLAHQFIRKHKWPVFLFLRNVLWIIGNGRTRRLKMWLDEFAPGLVLYTASDSTFSYQIALWVSRRYKIPLIVYCMDDYVTPRMRIDPFWWIQLFLVRRLFTRAVNISKKVLVIGDDMAREYQAKFKVACIPVMNCLELRALKDKRENRATLKLAYVGALHLGRWKILGLIGRALASLSKQEHPASLEIYCTGKLGSKVLKTISLPPFMRYCGALDEKGVQKVLEEADILVHVESFKKSLRRYTRLSVSTKIPEYLASGKSIFAVGPGEIASMRYLKSTGGAELVTEPKIDKIREGVRKLVENEELRNAMGRKGYETAAKNHSDIQVRRILAETLNSL